MFTLGAHKGWPDGWSRPAPLYNRYTRRHETLPIVWVKSRPATEADIEALYGCCGARGVRYDEGTIVGKASDEYETARERRLKELGVPWWQKWRF